MTIPSDYYAGSAEFRAARGIQAAALEYDFGRHRRQSRPDPAVNPPAWRVAVTAGGDVYAEALEPPYAVRLLGILRLPLPKPPELDQPYALHHDPDPARRSEPVFKAADRIFRGWADAGTGKTVEWFAERLRRHGCAPQSKPEDCYLTPREAADYGLPWQLTRSRLPGSPAGSTDPAAWLSLAIPEELAHYGRQFIVYRPLPGWPQLLRAYAFASQAQNPSPNADAATEPREFSPAEENSIRRRRRRLLRRSKACNAGARRRREAWIREALNLHPAWGDIGPFAHPQSSHVNWDRKVRRDQIRQAGPRPG